MLLTIACILVIIVLLPAAIEIIYELLPMILLAVVAVAVVAGVIIALAS